MHKFIWTGLLLGGVLTTGAGFGLLEADTGGESLGALTMLLTAGLSACLAGLLGLSGMMGWVPGLALPAATGNATKMEFSQKI